MEVRHGNLTVQTPGGNASKGSYTYKVSLPSAWMQEMSFGPENREIELSFDGSRIIISKRGNLQEFLQQRRGLGHKLLLLSFFDRNELCSEIAVDETERVVCVKDHISDVVRTAFGNTSAPNWEDYQTFLESRCIPETRSGLREYLDALGLDEYEPLAIIQKTGGRMAEDKQWLKVEVVL